LWERAVPANFCSSISIPIPAPAGGGAVLRLSRTPPGCPLSEKSLRSFFCARCGSLMPLNGTATRRGLHWCQPSEQAFAGQPAPTQAGSPAVTSRTLWRRRSARRAHRQRGFSLHRALPANTTPFGWHRKRLRRAVALFSGIRGPHRVSKETEALCDARAPGRGAGQPQNGASARRGRDRNNR